MNLSQIEIQTLREIVGMILTLGMVIGVVTLPLWGDGLIDMLMGTEKKDD